MPLRHLLRTARRRGAGAAPAAPARRRLRPMLAAALAALAVTAGLPVAGPAQAAPAVNYTNPLVNQRADPHIVKHTDGYYYMTATVPEYDRIVLRRATTLQGTGRRRGDDDLAPPHQRGDGRPHLGAGDPLHKRQVVRLLRRRTHRRRVADPDVRAGEREREPAVRLVDRTRPDHHAVGHVQPGRLDVRGERGAVPDLGPAGTRHLHQLQRLPRPHGRQPVADHRHGDPAGGPDVRLGDPWLPGRRGSDGDPAQRPGLPHLLGERHRRQLLPRHADRVRRREPARRRRLGQEPEPGVRQQRRHRPVRPRAQLLHRLRGRAERHPGLPRPQLPGHQRRPAQRPEPADPDPEALLERRRHPELRHPRTRRGHPDPAAVTRPDRRATSGTTTTGPGSSRT